MFTQFLSPLLNTRTDEYGGSLENRGRFPKQILKTIREAVGPDFLIELRIDGTDHQPNGVTPDETLSLIHIWLAAREQLRPEDLCGENFILPDGAESPGRTDELLAILKKMGIRCGKILYVPNQESMLLNVRTGKGIALMDNSLREVYDGDRYRFLEIPREMAPLYVVCVWKKENLNPAVPLYTNTLSRCV